MYACMHARRRTYASLSFCDVYNIFLKGRKLKHTHSPTNQLTHSLTQSLIRTYIIPEESGKEAQFDV